MLSKLYSVLVCVTFLLMATAGTSAETFRNPYRVPTSVDPATIAVGDFNNDGHPDIAWVDISTSPATLRILLAQPGGGYLAAPSIIFPIATTRPEECLVVDLNKDNRQDIVCTLAYQFTNEIAVYLGNGDGTFQVPIITVVSAQNNGGYVAPELFLGGDLNGDGFPDLIEGEAQNGGDQILLGDGHGGFQIGAVVQSGINSPNPFVADVNGDGHVDLLLAYGPQVEIGKGDGTFNAPVEYPATTGLPSCVFHDVDGDGHLDAVCSSNFASPDISVLHGNSDGSFNLTPIATQNFNTQTITGTYLFPMAVYDANGDGIPDIIAYAYDGVAVSLGKSGLTFAYPTHYAVGYLPFDTGQPNYQFIFADMNSDGIPDIVAIGPHGIYISYGQHDGSFATAPAYEVGKFVNATTVADFNGDGIPDIVATGDAALKLSFGKGDGSFGVPGALSTGSTSIDFTGGAISHGDFNGDDKQDLLAVGTSGGVRTPYIFFGHGDGTFDAPIPIANPTTFYSSSYPLNDASAIDINHDGRTDIVTPALTLQGPQLIANLSNGDGTFKSVLTNVPGDASAFVQDGYYFIFPTFADFNDDGKLDAAYGSYSNVYIVQGHGDGSFNTTALSMPIPPVNGVSITGSLATASGDFDGDGNADFAVLAKYGNTNTPFASFLTAVWIYYGDGHGNFSSPVLAGSFDRGYNTLAASDLNKDGLADLVLGFDSSYGSVLDQAGGNAISIVHAQPNRVFGPEINYTAGTFNSPVIVADLNKDGFPDLLVTNSALYAGSNTNSVTVLINNGNTAVVTGTLTASPEPSYVTGAFSITATLSPPTPGPALSGVASFAIDGNPAGSATLSANVATISGPTTLKAGIHQLSATWPGDTTFAPVILTAPHAVDLIPVAISLTSSPNPSSVDETVTFTTNFTPTPPAGLNIAGDPYTGTLTFYDGATILGQQQVAVSGFNFSSASLTAGSHSMTAVYSGDDIFAAATSNVITQTVDGLPSVSTLAINPASPQFGNPIILTATVAATTSPGPAVPTGSVIFTVDGTASSATPIVNGLATHSVAGLSAGVHTITCAYLGDAIYNPSNCTPAQTTIVAASTTLLLTSSANPAYALSTVTFTAKLLSNGQPTTAGNNITFGVNGQFINALTDNTGTAAYSISTLTPNIYPITATFATTTNLIASSSSLTETINIIPTSAALSVSPNGPSSGTPITLSASVAPLVGSGLTGTVTFSEGTTQIGAPVPVSTAGVANLAIGTLLPGPHTFNCTYSGSVVFAPSQCPSITVNVIPQDFAFTSSAPSFTVQTGHQSVVKLTIQSIGSFSGNVSIACTPPLPAYVTCELPGFPVGVASGAAATTTLTIDTDQLVNFYSSVSPAPANPSNAIRIALATLFPLALIGLKRRRLRQSLGLYSVYAALSITCLSMLTACGGHKNPLSTPPGTYNIPLTATGASNGTTIQHSLSLTLIVTP